MADNKDSVVTTLSNAKLKAVVDRVVREMELAAEKVACHHGDPAKYPLPTAKSAVEQLFAARFKSLPEGQRKKAADKAAAELKSPKRAGRLGDLAKVDLRSPASVEAQVRALPFPDKLKFPADELRKMPGTSLTEAAEEVQAEAVAQAVAQLKLLELRIHSVKCLDETSEIGKDEIHLGGTSIDESGDTKKISSFKVRSFNTGDVQTYTPPKRFTFFSLTESTVTFPKSYFVTLVLAEVDWGGLADFLNGLLDKVKSKVTAAVAAAIGGAIGSPGGPVGIAIGIAVGYAVTQIFDFLKGLWGDEVFKPITVSTVIPSLTSRWAGQDNSSDRSVEFAGHGGRYRLTYDWRMYN
ncbi:hypothetical protein H9Y04_05885 [Streptomyces sp. TRM66268-LWL]|uniref:Uncharacterized protein n=1 Tax=Streptomyces polyasparticus TaxID=2767826 RepID=A0ABR7S9K5_9ACTN|nr:hypothetical protein [Streptomyces polyasparticus]MBC9712098.1 hypothetical protein [Streptomyces polyasparticus]